jgi:hypothetical protein
MRAPVSAVSICFVHLWSSMSRSFSDVLLQQIRALPLARGLASLDYHVAVDRDFVPAKDSRSERWLVSSRSGSWEVVVTGLKWFDVRAQVGGGGMIDLVMQLEGLSFVAAVKRLAKAVDG